MTPAPVLGTGHGEERGGPTLAERIVRTGSSTSGPGQPHAPSGLDGRTRTTSTDRTPSSALSVDKLLLLTAAGYAPLGIVAGAAVFHAGLVGARLANAELVPLSQALLAAREQATARMRHHAAQLGAAGVVGARVEISAFEDQHHLARVVAFGTAVAPAMPADVETSSAVPFVAALTGRELGVLLDSGYEPVSLVMGVCVYHIARQRPRAWMRNLTTSGELGGYTAALYGARELAMRRLQDEALAAGGEGVVGVTTSETSHAWGSKAIEFFCMGTTIRKCSEPRLGQPATAISLRDLRTAADPAALHGRAARRYGGPLE